MRTTPRLCVIDVDGTLLTSAHHVTDVTRSAVERARARGVRIVLASSRGPAALLPVLDAVAAPAGDVFVASQGALTARRSDGGLLEVLERHPAPLDAARRLARSALDAGLAVSWFSGATWFVSHLDEEVRREVRVVGVSPQVADVTALPDAPDKLMLISPDVARLEALRRDLPAGLQAQVSNPTYLEVTAAGVDKASAVFAWCDREGIAESEVAAIGDGPNDLPLLARAGLSIAPANARPEVIAAVDVVVASNDDDGVAEALDAWMAP